jgi:hypothetical protein
MVDGGEMLGSARLRAPAPAGAGVGAGAGDGDGADAIYTGKKGVAAIVKGLTDGGRTVVEEPESFQVSKVTEILDRTDTIRIPALH